MATKTEQRNMERIQDALGVIREAIRDEIKGNTEQGHARHLNAWTSVMGMYYSFHADMTKVGLDEFPEFFGEIVIGPKGGGGSGRG